MSLSETAAQIYPQARGSLFVAFCGLAGLRWKYSNPLSHGMIMIIIIIIIISTS
jgi:hypothetical protein